MNKIFKNIATITVASYSLITSYNLLKKYDDDIKTKKDLQVIIDKLYYDNYKNHKRALITQPFHNLSNNAENIINTFSPISTIVLRHSLFFNQQKINSHIHKYLYGDFSKQSSTKTFNVTDTSTLSQLFDTHKDTQHKYVLINSKQCPSVQTKYPTQITTSWFNFSNSLIFSHAYHEDPQYDVLVIDTRNFEWNNKEIPSDLPKDVKFLISDQDNPGHDLKHIFTPYADELCFIGDYDQETITNMQTAFGSDYVTVQYPHITNVLDNILKYNPNLLVKKITQDETIDMISNPDKFGLTAFVSGDTCSSRNLPTASGGCYMYEINNFGPYNTQDKHITHSLIDHLLEKNVKSVVFTCEHSRSRGPHFSKLFQECLREKNISFNIFLMYPGVGRISSKKYEDAPTTETINLKKMFPL
uniref:Rhodanese domain-containing protein n=1 Tax=viral metagenome TaxID=1070528 RepID=A0A6C0E893_9ZZZZ